MTEHDFTVDKVSDGDTPLEEITEEYSQYVDPKYAEQIMQGSSMVGSEDNAPSGRKGPASETAETPAAHGS